MHDLDGYWMVSLSTGVWYAICGDLWVVDDAEELEGVDVSVIGMTCWQCMVGLVG